LPKPSATRPATPCASYSHKRFIYQGVPCRNEVKPGGVLLRCDRFHPYWYLTKRQAAARFVYRYLFHGFSLSLGGLFVHSPEILLFIPINSLLTPIGLSMNQITIHSYGLLCGLSYEECITFPLNLG
jgi:hypothetical protein